MTLLRNFSWKENDLNDLANLAKQAFGELGEETPALGMSDGSNGSFRNVNALGGVLGDLVDIGLGPIEGKALRYWLEHKGKTVDTRKGLIEAVQKLGGILSNYSASPASMFPYSVKDIRDFCETASNWQDLSGVFPSDFYEGLDLNNPNH